MKAKRDYQWFKGAISRGSSYRDLCDFKSECPRLYEQYSQRYQREQNPNIEIDELLQRS